MRINHKYQPKGADFDKPEGWGKLNLRRRLRRFLRRLPVESNYGGGEGECPECGANPGRDALSAHRWWAHGVILPAGASGVLPESRSHFPLNEGLDGEGLTGEFGNAE
jgi:hypothetical protein